MKLTHSGLIIAGIVLACVGVVALAHGVPDLALGTLVLANAPLALDSKEFKALEEAVSKRCGELVEAVQKALKDESEKFGTIHAKTNEKLTELTAEGKKAQDALAEFKQRLIDLEQKGALKPGGPGTETKSTGQVFIESDEYKSNIAKGNYVIPSVKVPNLHKTAILNQPVGTNPQTLVVSDRSAGFIAPSTRRLTIRDLLPQARTSSNLIEYASENVFTNNAGVQFSSPNDRENVVKNESGITFQLSSAPVVTVAHWIPASKQVLADANGLADYIDMRLRYGLKLYEEGQLLTGDGTGGNVTGLMTGATAYNRGVSNDSMIDCLLKAKLQVALSDYMASGYVLNPIDWVTIQLLKDTQGRYLFTNPQDVTTPRIWGLPVVDTQSQTQGQFLVGAFDLAAMIWDREDMQVYTSTQHSDFFVRNMVAILCEERLALTIFRTAALVKGSLPALGT